MKIKNIIGTNGKAIANQLIIENIDTKVFQSYDSKIATYYTNGDYPILVLTQEWDFGKTTLKYLKQFINEETTFNYVDLKSFKKEIETNPLIRL